jgi:hypothetical protein
MNAGTRTAGRALPREKVLLPAEQPTRARRGHPRRRSGGRPADRRAVLSDRAVLPLGVSCSAAIAVAGSVGTVHGMSYASDLTDEQRALVEPVFNAPGSEDPSTRRTCGGWWTRCSTSPTPAASGGFCPRRSGPGPVWSPFRRWSRNGTWARALTVPHKAAREADGRTGATPSMVVIDTHLARGASNGGFTFHDRGGPYGRTKATERVVAVDVTGLSVGALVVPASTHENRTSEVMLEHLTRQGVTDRLELVLVDRGVTAAGARTLGRRQGLEVRRVGWDAPADWRSRSRTPPPQRPAGSKPPVSRPPCVTCQLPVDAVAGSLSRRRRRSLPARSSRHMCESPRIVQ